MFDSSEEARLGFFVNLADVMRRTIVKEGEEPQLTRSQNTLIFSPPIVHPRIHADSELQFLLHFSPRITASFSFDQMWRPIGNSKRSCLCCTLWINAFDAITIWATNGSHGKLGAS